MSLATARIEKVCRWCYYILTIDPKENSPSHRTWEPILESRLLVSQNRT